MPEQRRYKAIILDWEELVKSREVAALPEPLAAALSAGISCAILAEADFETIDRQCLSGIPASARQNLHLCTNRGSEVFAFLPNGAPIQLFRRVASVEEAEALDRVALRTRDLLRSRGCLDLSLEERLNRRTVRIGRERRGQDQTPSVAELGEIAFSAARETGFKDPRIRLDEGVVEIGLTDKSDSLAWLRDHVFRPRHILPQDVGHVGKSPTEGALGPSGGVAVFLRTQATLPPSSEMKLDPAWRIEQLGFDPSREREMEPLFAIGNGRVGIRGSASLPLPSSEDDLFLAGIYDRKSPELPYSEAMLSDSRSPNDCELVPFPSPFPLGLRMDGREVSLLNTNVLEFSRTLDLCETSLGEEIRFALPNKSSSFILRTTRYASLSDPHLLIQRIEIRSEGEHSVEIDTSMLPSDLPNNHPHLSMRIPERGELSEILEFSTRYSGMKACFASRLFLANAEVRGTHLGPLRIDARRPISAWRMISIFTSRDGENPEEAARNHCLGFHPMEIEDRITDHRQAWERFWNTADIEFEGAPELCQALRFGLYQLRISADRDPGISIGAKGLTGRAYEGHIFWDAEIFAFPFFLYTEPELARNFLLYRHHTLEGARARARAQGCRGASYAWESTLTGQDVTPEKLMIQGSSVPIFTGKEQLHITADVAHAVWKYWDATLDLDFLENWGLEILAETARFWASRVSRRDGLLHIDRVVGPDEYHHDVNDNAYTNWMAAFNLEKAVALCEIVRSEDPARWDRTSARLRISEDELSEWTAVHDQLFLPAPGEDGVIEQFEGFFKLKDITPAEDQALRAPIHRLFAWAEVNQLKLVKQADVLMLPFLFPENFSREIVRANYLYYEPKTEHGSSLSPCVHAAIAFRSGMVEEGMRLWNQSRAIDLQNIMKNTALGIHIGAIGGTWQALVFHMLNIDPNGSCKSHESPATSDPILPTPCQEIRFKIRYRDQTRAIRVQQAGGRR